MFHVLVYIIRGIMHAVNENYLEFMLGVIQKK